MKSDKRANDKVVQEIENLLKLQQQNNAALENINRSLVNAVKRELKRGASPLTQDEFNRQCDRAVKEASLGDLLMLAEISNNAYYKARANISSSKVGTLNAFLGAFGMQLYIGPKVIRDES